MSGFSVAGQYGFSEKAGNTAVNRVASVAASQQWSCERKHRLGSNKMQTPWLLVAKIVGIAYDFPVVLKFTVCTKKSKAL